MSSHREHVVLTNHSNVRALVRLTVIGDSCTTKIRSQKHRAVAVLFKEPLEANFVAEYEETDRRVGSSTHSIGSLSVARSYICPFVSTRSGSATGWLGMTGFRPFCG